MTQRHSLGASLRWSYVMDGGRQAITMLLSLVLAALLGPEAFGVIAMALVFMSFIEMLLKQGMAAAVVQREDLRQTHLDTAFWMVMGAALVLTITSAALSGWWATVNRTPELGPVVLALTVMVPLQGLTVVQEAILRREFRFKSLAVRANASVLVGGVVGIALAIAGAGVWALVAQQVTTALVAVIVLWTVSGWRPGRRLSRRAASELLGFSVGSFLGGLGVFLVNRADALLIGLLFGPLVVGLYRLAGRLVEAVVGVTVSALMSVALPELSRAQNDPERFRRAVGRLTWISAVLAVPPLGLLAGLSGEILGVIGEEWVPAAGALRLLCVAGAVRALFACTGPLLQALGHPFEQAAVAWGVGVLSTAGFVIAGFLVAGMPVQSQLQGLALSQALLYGIVFGALCAWIMKHRAGVTLQAFAVRVWPAVGAGLLATASGALASHAVGPHGLGPWPRLVATAIPVGIVTLFVLAASDDAVRAQLRAWVALRRRHVTQRDVPATPDSPPPTLATDHPEPDPPRRPEVRR